MSKQNFGFGPLGVNATTERPDTVDIDGFDAQTWFKNASGPGKKDGTTINASWLNHIVGNLVHLCRASGIAFSNSHGSDHFLYDAVMSIIKKIVDFGRAKEGDFVRYIDGKFVATTAKLDSLADVNSSRAAREGELLTFKNGKWVASAANEIEGAATTEFVAEAIAAERAARELWQGGEASAREGADTALAAGKLSKTDVVANLSTNDATKALAASQGVVLASGVQSALDNAAAALDAANAITDDALLKVDVVDDLTTGGAGKALSAAQGVALKALVDAISAGALSAAALASAPFGAPESVAAGATVDLGAATSVTVEITGSGSTISSFGTTGASLLRFVTFAAANTLQHGASLMLPGAANITTAAGDCLIAISDASDAWRVLSYVKANGTPIVLSSQAEAEAGTEATKPMTALRVAQAITARAPALTNLKWKGADFTVSTAAPSGGANGDFWFQREA